MAEAYRTKAEIEVISDVPIVRCNEELNQEIVEGLKGSGAGAEGGRALIM